MVTCPAREYAVQSPDGRIVATVNDESGLSLRVAFDGREVTHVSQIGLNTKTQAVRSVRRSVVRDDITAASPVRIGRIGSSPEIHEKIAPNGNGLFVMFANEGGDHVYVTEHSVAPVLWKSDGVAVEKDAKGRAVLRCHFEKASAVIVVFGDFGNTRKVPES
jgi:hypothetical protein